MPAIINCEQGTLEWHEARRGIPTASEFATVLAKGKGGGESVTRRKYLLTLVGEILTGEVTPDGYTNPHMERGKTMEAEARNAYAFMVDTDPEQVGFIRNGEAGASPDSLVGTNGLLEIKTKLPHLLLDCIMQDRLPPEHVAQCQGQLWIAEREWLDFVAYWPKLPLFRFRVTRDEPYIAGLKAAVDQFNDEKAALVARFRK